jgi:hypothetical protein
LERLVQRERCGQVRVVGGSPGGWNGFDVGRCAGCCVALSLLRAGCRLPPERVGRRLQTPVARGAAMAKKRNKQERVAPKGSPLNIKAFENRVKIEGEIYNSVQSSITGPQGQTLPSSFPHLTHGTDQRAAHITSSRVVCVNGNFTIHERFHQDDDGSKDPVHDRFFAVDNTTGVVYTATATWNPNMHIGKKDEKPMRGAYINSTVNAKLVFQVGAVDDKSPPLSPRSRTRAVPDTGYS